MHRCRRWWWVRGTITERRLAHTRVCNTGGIDAVWARAMGVLVARREWQQRLSGDPRRFDGSDEEDVGGVESLELDAGRSVQRRRLGGP